MTISSLNYTRYPKQHYQAPLAISFRQRNKTIILPCPAFDVVWFIFHVEVSEKGSIMRGVVHGRMNCCIRSRDFRASSLSPSLVSLNRPHFVRLRAPAQNILRMHCSHLTSIVYTLSLALLKIAYQFPTFQRRMCVVACLICATNDTPRTVEGVIVSDARDMAILIRNPE
jgi:hypothetical protein